MSTVQMEEVLVVPTALFHEIGHFQGFSTEIHRYLDQLLLPEHISYRPRDEMEDDPSFKQLIPYVIFRHRNADEEESVFVYTRGKGQGEARLRRKKSVGIGGHISTVDADSAGSGNSYDEGMRRELEEEVEISSEYSQSCVGLINDDETEVGRVHLGVVHLFDVQSPEVRPREDEIIEAGFQPIERVLADLDQFETWSQISLQALFG